MSDSDDEGGFMPPWARALHRAAAKGDLEAVREVLEVLYSAHAAVAARAAGGGGGSGSDEEEEDAGAVFGAATTSEEDDAGAPEDDGDDEDDDDDDEEEEAKGKEGGGNGTPPPAKKQKTAEEEGQEEDKDKASDDPNAPPPTLAAALAAAAEGRAPWPRCLPLDVKDWGEATPLHAALMGGHAQVAQLLLQCGASPSLPLDGCPPLHLAACVGMQRELRPAAVEMVKLLLDGAGAGDEAAADPLQRDDGGRTALHWAAEHGLVAAAEAILDKSDVAEARLRAAMAEDDAAVAAAAAEAAAAAGEPAPPAAPASAPPGPPTLSELVDSNGDTALHLAAKHNHADIVRLLLKRGQAGAAVSPGAAPDALCSAKNKHGMSPAHLAAQHGAGVEVAKALAEAAPEVVATLTDRRGLTAAALALQRGLPDLVEPLLVGAAASSAEGKKLLAAAKKLPDRRRELFGGNGRSSKGGNNTSSTNTLIVAPPECGRHLTHPAGPRGQAVGSEPPPENPGRVEVLVDESRGILRAESLSEGLKLQWVDQPGMIAPCPMSDVLRVHDWPYVRRLERACAELPEDDDAIGRLDADTAVSRGTYAAALAAAGAVVHAVDAVLSGEARNAFCAVRPPGHHAGPRGVVPSAVDPNGSHGFCLLNNVAIGAAYAMAVHRHKVRRVAILDFDVHHGNGTEACVVGTAPRAVRVPFSTGLSEGVQVYHTWKPWRDSDDGDHVLFISVQGVGPKAHGVDAYVYPGSGATHDSKKDPPPTPDEEEEAARGKSAGAADTSVKPEQNGGGGGQEEPVPMDTEEDDKKKQQEEAAAAAAAAEEDPDGEFKGVLPPPADAAPPDGPRVIDVGIPGPGFHPALWRRAWRDKALPSLANFKPDLILVSAGFDAHRKDDINFRYIGATEADYEWLTDQIVQVANGCCEGRVVSVLEGGYNLRGRGACSAFARSVAAHVRAMAEPNFQAWDASAAKRERDTERRRREERAAKAAARAAAAAERRAAAMAAEAAALVAEAAEAAGVGGEGGEAAAAAAAPASGGRRRRAPVDYAALNAQLEAEKKAGGGGAE
jgi:acetoin utilization deacetylase AcuC-like enzyme/ankyrin repeat protein